MANRLALSERCVDAADVGTWRRVGPLGVMTIIAGGFLVVWGSIVLAIAVNMVLQLPSDPVPTAVVVLFVACWWTFAWRLVRTGLYVSQTGLRLVYPWRTRTLPWSSVVEIASRPAKVLGIETVRDAIWVTTATGQQIETPVQRRAPWRSIGWRKNTGPVLTAARYERAIDLLRTYQAAAGAPVLTEFPRSVAE